MSVSNAGVSSAVSVAAPIVQKQGNQSLPLYAFMNAGAGGVPTFACIPEAMVPNLVGLPAGITVSGNELAFALNLLTNAAASGGRQFLISHEVAAPDSSSVADAAGQSVELNPQVLMQYLADSTVNVSTDAFSIPSLSELNAAGNVEQFSNDLNVGAHELVLEEEEQTGIDGKHHPLHIA